MPNKNGERVKKKNSHEKQILVVSIIAFFVFAFALNFVNVSQFSEQGPNIITGHSIVGNFFTNWNGGNLNISIAKYLFWIILTL